MKELFKSNDAVQLSFAQALLAERGVKAFLFDQYMSILDGSIGALPRRLMVSDEDYAPARRILAEMGVLGEQEDD